jgi:hypothetical protein
MPDGGYLALDEISRACRDRHLQRGEHRQIRLHRCPEELRVALYVALEIEFPTFCEIANQEGLHYLVRPVQLRDRSCCKRLAAAMRSRVWKPSEKRLKIGSRSSSALSR